MSGLDPLRRGLVPTLGAQYAHVEVSDLPWGVLSANLGGLPWGLDLL
jgi:hypothetical protein